MFQILFMYTLLLSFYVVSLIALLSSLFTAEVRNLYLRQKLLKKNCREKWRSTKLNFPFKSNCWSINIPYFAKENNRLLSFYKARPLIFQSQVKTLSFENSIILENSNIPNTSTSHSHDFFI